jgi:histidinol-phosphatase (PHP family)
MKTPGSAESEGIGFGNFHTHTRHCDGKGEAREFAEAALQKGMPRLGFSGHNVVPFPASWTMPAGNLETYLRDVREVRLLYQGRLEIFLGMEVDYLPGVAPSPRSAARSLKLDYVIGSVHFIAPVDGQYVWTVDGAPEELELGLRESFHGDIRALVERYFARVAEMARTEAPDIVGHFDLVKKNNRAERWFREDARWYRDAARAALAAVAASGSVLEVNTGGVVRNTSGALYPSPWILAEALDLKVPVVVTSDAHRPDQLDGQFAETVRLLRDIGFRTQRQLTAGGWVDQGL